MAGISNPFFEEMQKAWRLQSGKKTAMIKQVKNIALIVEPL
jgi:hypothetical protein